MHILNQVPSCCFDSGSNPLRSASDLLHGILIGVLAWGPYCHSETS